MVQHDLQRKQGLQDSQREKEEITQQQSWPLIVRKRGSIQDGKDTMLRWYNWLYETKKKGEEKRRELEHQK